MRARKIHPKNGIGHFNEHRLHPARLRGMQPAPCRELFRQIILPDR